MRYLGYVADEDLPGLYAGAEALFYPSHYEGFGLPPVEMMACGGVCGGFDGRRGAGGRRDAAPALEPNDLEGWRDAMRLHDHRPRLPRPIPDRRACPRGALQLGERRRDDARRLPPVLGLNAESSPSRRAA